MRVLTAFALLLAASAAAAQTSLPPPPPGDDVLSLRIGDRVRVWAAAPPPLAAAVGTVNATDEDGLALMIRKRVRVVPYPSLRKLEVRRTHRHGKIGAVAGAVLGATASLFLEDIVNEDDLKTWEWVAGVTAFTAAGAGLGAFVGHHVRTHSWAPLALLPPPRPAAAPPRAPGLSFSIRF